MFTIPLPVVAHRIFGLQHPTGTVWTRERRVSKLDTPYMLAKRILEAEDSQGEDDTDLSPLEYSVYVSPGTRRSIDEIRDFFDGERRAETTGEQSINAIWEQAGIRFRLVSIVDHAIRSDHALLMLGVYNYARRLTQPGVVNVYFVRAIDGGAGAGFASPWPYDTRKKPAYAFLQDWEESESTWEQAVWTLSHELGHLLSLSHEGNPDNLMWAWIGISGVNLRPVQIMVARDYARRYLPGVQNLCVMSPLFSTLYRDEEAEPHLSKAYRGEVWRFGKFDK